MKELVENIEILGNNNNTILLCETNNTSVINKDISSNLITQDNNNIIDPDLELKNIATGPTGLIKGPLKADYRLFFDYYASLAKEAYEYSNGEIISFFYKFLDIYPFIPDEPKRLVIVPLITDNQQLFDNNIKQKIFDLDKGYTYSNIEDLFLPSLALIESKVFPTIKSFRENGNLTPNQGSVNVVAKDFYLTDNKIIKAGTYTTFYGLPKYAYLSIALGNTLGGVTPLTSSFVKTYIDNFNSYPIPSKIIKDFKENGINLQERLDGTDKAYYRETSVLELPIFPNGIAVLNIEFYDIRTETYFLIQYLMSSKIQEIIGPIKDEHLISNVRILSEFVYSIDRNFLETRFPEIPWP